MEKKLYESNCIVVDGKMDEPVWETAQTYTDFRFMKSANGGELAKIQTEFKILPCKDRIYFGIRCMEPDMDHVKRTCRDHGLWNTDSIELFLAPSGNTFDVYQFAMAFSGENASFFYSENGVIQPDPYAPQWKYAVYAGEDYWTIEAEFPLTAFYMTPDNLWSEKWLMNVCRTRGYTLDGHYKKQYTTWGVVDMGYMEPEGFRPMEGIPVRPACDDVRISSASVELSRKDENGFHGVLTVKTINPEDCCFVFTSEYSEPVEVQLKAGSNEFKVPCTFTKCARYNIALSLKRVGDGKEFLRYYPVRVAYEPIKLHFTAPEYRADFFPGQDYSHIAGSVSAAKSVTMRLEGPGIETTTLTLEEGGEFCFDTSNFDYGEATLTVMTEDDTLVKRIRRLPPTERMMSWISKGNVVVNGTPVLPRRMYATHYLGGDSFNRRFDADNLHITGLYGQAGFLDPCRFLGTIGRTFETRSDDPPCEQYYAYLDKLIEDNSKHDFAYYYISDEPECYGISPVYLKYIYDYLVEKDPYHVVLLCSRAADNFLDAADWFETHPYINPYTEADGTRMYSREINTVGKCIDDIALLNRPDKCIGFVSTCFGGIPAKPEPYPTFEEYICHIWAAMIRGGKTLWAYAYHDLNDRPCLYEGTRYIFSSFEALEQLVLHGKRTTLIRNMDVEAVHYDKGDEQMFVLVNMSQQPQQVTLDGLSGEWYHFRRDSKITGNTFTLKPLEVIIGTSGKKDAGLPTYEETANLIDKLEYERTHGGSLLFGRHRDIAITATVSTSKYKLFDGMLDNWAWACVQKGEKFMELDLSKIKPCFNKVVIHGSNIADMDIQVSVNGELVAPVVADVKTEEFTTTFMLQDAVSADALRLEFHAYDAIELYEIEVFRV